MALARVQYQQQLGTNRSFSVPFPYISKDHIKVSVDGTDVTFSWLSASSVQLATAPAIGSIIDIRRETERSVLLVDFQDASTIEESQLDLMAQQTFYIAQEAFDATGGTMAVANDGSFSANNRRITNLGLPDSDDDAVNAGWVKGQYSSGKDAHQERLLAETARTSAEAARDSAKTAETTTLGYRNTANDHRLAAASSASAAKTSETNAANSAAAAKSSENTVAADALAAKNSATAAKTSEDNALSHKNSAASSASSASSNATSASNSNAKAQLWAEANEDSAVELGKYSAKHHAAKASASAASASTSASNALNYRDAANTAKTAAEAARSGAEAAQTAAKTSETNAATSATAAADSAASVDAANLVRKDQSSTINGTLTLNRDGQALHLGTNSTSTDTKMTLGPTAYGWELFYEGSTGGLTTGNAVYLRSTATGKGFKIQHDGKAYLVDGTTTDQLITRKGAQELLECRTTSAGGFAEGQWVITTFNIVDYSTMKCGSWNTGTSKFTATEDCILQVAASVHMGSSAGAGNGVSYLVGVAVNGTVKRRLTQIVSTVHSGAAFAGASIVGLAAGDTLEIRMYVGGPSPVVNSTSPDATYLTLARIG